jgi:hypothetical protein
MENGTCAYIIVHVRDSLYGLDGLDMDKMDQIWVADMGWILIVFLCFGE